jgi:hypothetical protein
MTRTWRRGRRPLKRSVIDCSVLRIVTVSGVNGVVIVTHESLERSVWTMRSGEYVLMTSRESVRIAREDG